MEFEVQRDFPMEMSSWQGWHVEEVAEPELQIWSLLVFLKICEVMGKLMDCQKQGLRIEDWALDYTQFGAWKEKVKEEKKKMNRYGREFMTI